MAGPPPDGHDATMEHEERSRAQLVEEIDDAHAALGAAHRRFLRLIAAMERTRAWEDDGARDLAQWLWMRYGMSDWKARRWIEAAGVLPILPRTADAAPSKRPPVAVNA